MKRQDLSKHIFEKRLHEHAYFIAANGYTGFRSRYDIVFHSPNYTHIYVIQGGPGTGKSRMMREIANAVEAQGGQSEYIYCSSDPDSLDAVILSHQDRRIAVLDGTAPHTRGADFPGVIDEITNLGEFWDSNLLTQQRPHILSLCQKKSNQYQIAYQYLALAGAADTLLHNFLQHCIDTEKLTHHIKRIVYGFSGSPDPEEKIEYWSACSMKGKFSSLPVPENTQIICTDNYLNSGRFYLNTLRDALRDNSQISYIIVPSVYDDKIVDGLYLPQNNILFLNGLMEGAKRIIHMKRFLIQEQIGQVRGKLRQLNSLHEELTNTAVSHLRLAGKYHFELEKVYSAAMDFSAKEAYVKQLIEKIIAILFTSES